MPRAIHKHDGRECTSGLSGKACDDRYADAQAAQEVRLAARIVQQGRARQYHGGKDVFSQLVLVLAGEREAITAGDGEASEAPFTRRITAMIDAYKREFPDWNTGGTAHAS